MTDQESAPAPGEGGSTPPPRPTWVKALLLVVVFIAAVLLLIFLTSGDHGPGRHALDVGAFTELY